MLERGIKLNNKSSVLFGSLFESSWFSSVRFAYHVKKFEFGSVCLFSVGIEFDFCSVRFVKLKTNVNFIFAL